MTPDPFEQHLRARLHDLADAEPPWPDVTQAAMQQGSAASPVRQTRSTWRRLAPALAVAAVLAALVVGVGIGASVLGGRSGSNSSGSVAVGAQDAGSGLVPDKSVPPAAGGTSLAPCGATPTSSGPLASIATLSTGVVPAVASGGSVEIPVALTFSGVGPTMQARVPVVYAVADGQIVGRPSGVGPLVITNIAVEPGTRAETVSFLPTDCAGGPLPAGSYQVVVAYPYSVASGAAQPGSPSGAGTLVSAPTTVEVS